ncbi:MAG: isoleucine--tRNA ligase [Candidatus Levybacteria bacterium]|nr:isoleucine--tRNA ligase [Candidatus Levybacteria bacterium]
MVKPTFKPVSPKVDFPKLEEEILLFWKKNKIFEKSIESRPKEKKWTFLDGPPFVTGLPHYGHLLTSIAKDLFPRFWTMKGYRVRRVWGWDGHGLPVENKVENKLNIKRKKDIEEVVGVAKFIEECKKYVTEVSGEWEWYVDHIGRWVDFTHAYRTWDLPYMESVMWVFRQIYDKGFIYKGLRVSLYCPHCATPISNFEVAMDADNYKDVSDPATVYKYPLKNEESTYILAWSTTPWNKIVTPALAVNSKLTYVKVQQGNERYILAKATLKMLKKEPYKIVEEFVGKDLIGKKFIPHYDYYPIAKGEKAFEIVKGDFVTADEGTGVVTIAAYGEEDLKVMQEQGIHIEMHLDEEGIIKENVPRFKGVYYLKANKAVNEDLYARGLVYKDEQLSHSVPLCWRCHTRLYYAPQNAWFISVQALKKQMKKTNKSVNWVPAHFKHGRFLKSLENAPDWNISRSRFWGSPVPVWECPPADGCGEWFVPGSIEELENESGKIITDLHKPAIDDITVTCKKCGKTAKRVPEVLDSWIEAGSASFGERHFPFAKTESLKAFYPPDFIVEYTGQIRAWFYVLHVISNALYATEAFKNVLVNGVILGTDGRKMSKNYGNYPDPKLLLEKYGGDALRLYLMSSPVVRGEDIIISEEHYRNQVRGILLILWNVYNFFVSNANVDKWRPPQKFVSSSNKLDMWILSRLKGNIDNMRKKGYEKYDTPEVVGQASIFMRDLSLWYVRRSRDRVGPSADDNEDKRAAHFTLWTVLTEYSKALAPLIPFITESIYKNLTGKESVHLEYWPSLNDNLSNPDLEIEMDFGMKLASKIHSLRKEHNVKVRIPLKRLSYTAPKKIEDTIEKIVKSEVNIYDVIYKGKSEEINIEGDFSEKNQDIEAGKARDIIRQIQQERKRLGTALDSKVNVTIKDWPLAFEETIKKEALVRTLIKGDLFHIQPA